MKFVTFKGEQDISVLVRRIFNISGPGAAELAGEARKALLEANPQLESISTLRPGSVLVVPEIPGVSLTAEASTDVVMGVEVFDELRRALDETKTRLEISIDSNTHDLHKTLAALEDPELQSVKDQFPELSPELDRIGERAKRELDEVDDAKRSLKHSFEFFEKELENLRNRLT